MFCKLKFVHCQKIFFRRKTTCAGKTKVSVHHSDLYFISIFNQDMYPLKKKHFVLMHNKDPKFMEEVIDAANVQI